MAKAAVKRAKRSGESDEAGPGCAELPEAVTRMGEYFDMLSGLAEKGTASNR